MKWERTFEFSAPVDRVWRTFTDDEPEFVLFNPGNAYLSGGAVAVEFTERVTAERLSWRETEGDRVWEMTVSFASTDTGSSITIVRSGFGDDNEWLNMGCGRFLGWADVLSDLEIYFRTGTKLNRLFSRGWGRSGMSVVEETGGLRVIAVDPGGAAERAGLQAGDVLVRVAGAPTVTMSDHWFFESVTKPDADVDFEFVRDGEIRTGTAKLAGANA